MEATGSNEVISALRIVEGACDLPAFFGPSICRFDLKTLHRTILGPGALPLPDLQWHVDHEVDWLCRQRESES